MAENLNIKTFEFKSLPLEVEVKDLDFARTVPQLMGIPHKANFYQLIWITQGHAVFNIDFQQIAMNEGEAVLVSAGQVCAFDMENSYEGKHILFTENFFTLADADFSFLHGSEILNPFQLNRVVQLPQTVFSSILHLLIVELNHTTDGFQQKIAQSYLRILLFEMERRFNKTASLPTHSIARRFYDAVESDFKKSRFTQYYLNHLGLNEKALSREIKAFTNQTPKEFIDARIILEAKRLLSYSEKTVKEIGFELGFDEPTNFNKYFKKKVSQTPLEFRNLLNKEH